VAGKDHWDYSLKLMKMTMLYLAVQVVCKLATINNSYKSFMWTMKLIHVTCRGLSSLIQTRKFKKHYNPRNFGFSRISSLLQQRKSYIHDVRFSWQCEDSSQGHHGGGGGGGDKVLQNIRILPQN
jgi:hypothetical protein